MVILLSARVGRILNHTRGAAPLPRNVEGSTFEVVLAILGPGRWDTGDGPVARSLRSSRDLELFADQVIMGTRPAHSAYLATSRYELFLPQLMAILSCSSTPFLRCDMLIQSGSKALAPQGPWELSEDRGGTIPLGS